MSATEGTDPEGGRVRYFAGATAAQRVTPRDVNVVMEVLDAPGGAVIGRAVLVGWAPDGTGGGGEVIWGLAVRGRLLPGLFLLRGGEFVPADPHPPDQ
jgi:hypothetical protein